jgi:hypothetical protein
MGGVEVRELSDPLGQDSNDGFERLNGEERIEHLEGSEVCVLQHHLSNERWIKDESRVIGRCLGFFARFLSQLMKNLGSHDRGCLTSIERMVTGNDTFKRFGVQKAVNEGIFHGNGGAELHLVLMAGDLRRF